MQLRGSIEIDGTLSGRLQDEQGLSGKIQTENSLSGSLSRSSRSYNDLTELPKINSVTVIGSKSLPDYGLRPIYYDTEANWNDQTNLVSEEGAIYIYTYGTGDDIKFKIKIGDGNAYLIDMPFVVDQPVSGLDKEFWNNKVSAYISLLNDEELVLSTDSYMKNGELIYHG